MDRSARYAWSYPKRVLPHEQSQLSPPTEVTSVSGSITGGPCNPKFSRCFSSFVRRFNLNIYKQSDPGTSRAVQSLRILEGCAAQTSTGLEDCSWTVPESPGFSSGCPPLNLHNPYLNPDRRASLWHVHLQYFTLPISLLFFDEQLPEIIFPVYQEVSFCKSAAMRSISTRETEADRCLVYWDDQQDDDGLIKNMKPSAAALVSPSPGQRSSTSHVSVSNQASISSPPGDLITTVSCDSSSKALPDDDKTSKHPSKPVALPRPSRLPRKRRGGLKEVKRTKDWRQSDNDPSSEASRSSDSANPSTRSPYLLPSRQQAWDALTAKLTVRKHRPANKNNTAKVNFKSQTIKSTSKKPYKVTDGLRNDNNTIPVIHHPSLTKQISDPQPPLITKPSATVRGAYADPKAD